MNATGDKDILVTFHFPQKIVCCRTVFFRICEVVSIVGGD